ncbi:MAG: NAD-dependent deacylase [Fidelibacterota bacterium]|nr:MAG: NAD-dependent deacylase [Candidatus Neomarinimicrobiota bacterium]
MDIQPITPTDYRTIVFFTGAGMSAESGVPTYRGRGGIWAKYNWQEVACEEAFRRNPGKVLEFHALRRQQLTDCQPHQGHSIIGALENSHPDVTIITQNIDGLHQRAGSQRIIELHGSLWRLRCSREGKVYHLSLGEKSPVRCQCGAWLRPDIIWFGDCLIPDVVQRATEIVGRCDLLIAVGTSAVVWPAAGFPQLARDQGAQCIEINPEATEMSFLYHVSHQGSAGEVLPALFPDAITA